MTRERKTDFAARHKLMQRPQELVRPFSERSEHGFPSDDPVSPPVDQCYRVLMDLVDRNLSVLNGEDPSALDESIRRNLKGKPLHITVRRHRFKKNSFYFQKY